MAILLPVIFNRFEMKLKMIFLFLFSSVYVFAHESRPLLISIKQQHSEIIISYSVPNTVDINNLPFFSFDKMPRQKLHLKTQIDGFHYQTRLKANLNELKTKSLNLVFPFYNPTLSTIVQVYFHPNNPTTYILKPENALLQIGKQEKPSKQNYEFLGLGIEHIFKGYDHLLFVLCLLLITGIQKKLLWTITGFTMAHSLTLYLSITNLMQVPSAFVEVCIALSIILLCAEIIRNGSLSKPSNLSLTYKYPIIVATAFGLLHGLGFASVLKEIGLPQNQLISSLLFFNLGVEIGQILFVASLVLFYIIFRKYFNALTNYSFKIKNTIGYGGGILASFWFFQRIVEWF